MFLQQQQLPDSSNAEVTTLCLLEHFDWGEVIEVSDLFKVNHSGDLEFYCSIFSSCPSASGGCVYTVYLHQELCGITSQTNKKRHIKNDVL